MAYRGNTSQQLLGVELRAQLTTIGDGTSKASSNTIHALPYGTCFNIANLVGPAVVVCSAALCQTDAANPSEMLGGHARLGFAGTRLVSYGLLLDHAPLCAGFLTLWM